jgi:hypothetical protein
MLTKNILLSLVYCLLLNSAVSDIPSHCLSSQIMGEWIFYHTEAVPKTLKDLYDHKCGIKDHTDKHHIRDINMDLNTFTKTFEVKFNQDHTSELIKNSNGFNIQKVKIFIKK